MMFRLNGHITKTTTTTTAMSRTTTTECCQTYQEVEDGRENEKSLLSCVRVSRNLLHHQEKEIV